MTKYKRTLKRNRALTEQANAWRMRHDRVVRELSEAVALCVALSKYGYSRDGHEAAERLRDAWRTIEGLTDAQEYLLREHEAGRR
jgi:hypothetical protein